MSLMCFSSVLNTDVVWKFADSCMGFVFAVYPSLNWVMGRKGADDS